MKAKIFKKYVKPMVMLLTAATTLVSCDKFLTRDPQDTAVDTPTVWDSEENLRASFYTLYPHFFPGYRTEWIRSDWFADTNVADWNDDNAQKQATFFTAVAPTSEPQDETATDDQRTWYFTYVRSVNVLMNRIAASSLSDEAKNHWLGVARFMRAMEYARLVQHFGDVPYYTEVMTTTDTDELYAARTPRAQVMDKVLEDLAFACSNIRMLDGTAGLCVSRPVAQAFASRIMLFEGTWQEYREKNKELAAKYLKAAKDYAAAVMDCKAYSLCPEYHLLTTSETLEGNPEIILYRSYVEGVVMHSVMTFQNTETENSSPSRSLIDSYLSSNGLPIHQSGNALFTEGVTDRWFFDEIKNRDPRLFATIDTTGLRLGGVRAVSAISGYYSNRFVNETLVDKAGGKSFTNITDAPIMKLNEVLLNYLEAAAELSELGVYQLTQSDLDRTVNTLRDRQSTHMPHVTLVADGLQVNGVTIDDPKRDSDVSPLLWEIRRERRVELVYEGLRFNDLRRWGKLHYADMVRNPDVNRGAWLDKSRYVEWYNVRHPDANITLDNLKSISLDREGDAGYIMPITQTDKMRTMSEKDYLYPIPIDQITLYKSHNFVLEQNPGW